MKVGIFGGGFNPPHNGHINSILTVTKKIGLDKVHIIPNATNPLKNPVEGTTADERLDLTRKAFETYGNQFIVDDQEVKRGGVSYTIDTILNLRKTIEAQDLFLVIGADNFDLFNKWKDYKKILGEVNLIVTTRPGHDLPETVEELPDYLKELVAEYDFNMIELNTGRSIQFITLRDIEVSSTELRKALRSGRPVAKFLPLAVESYIKENKLYRNLGDRIGDYKKFTEFCAQILFDKKGISVKGFDLSGIEAPTDYTLICSGTSTRHTSALAENVAQAVKEEYNVHPQSIEGLDEGRWVLLDYGSLIIHVFYDFVRQEYNLEKIWKDGKEISLSDKSIK